MVGDIGWLAEMKQLRNYQRVALVFNVHRLLDDACSVGVRMITGFAPPRVAARIICIT